MVDKNKKQQQLKERILKEEDFIYCPRLGNSIERLIESNPNGVDEKRMAKVLLMSKEDIEKWYNSAIEKLREKLINGED